MFYSKQPGYGGTHSPIFNFKTSFQKRGDRKDEEDFFAPFDLLLKWEECCLKTQHRICDCKAPQGWLVLLE